MLTKIKGNIRIRYDRIIPLIVFIIVISVISLRSITRYRSEGRSKSSSTLITTNYDDLSGQYVCFAQRNFVGVGGVETWVMNLIKILKRGGVNVLGIMVTSLYSDKMHDFLFEQKLRLLSSYDVQMQCDVVINTQYFPIKGVINILVVHGSDMQYTYQYSKRSREYDEVVVVSETSEVVIPRSDRHRIIWIPTNVDPTECESGIDSSGKTIFLGRVSNEKAPDVFCKKVKELNLDGLMIGPSYSGQRPAECEGIPWVQGTSCPGDVIKKSEMLWVPSPEEGGPIVAIEAMMYKKPFIMSKTGLARDNDLITTTDWKFDKSTYRQLTEKSTKNIDALHENYLHTFSSAVILQKWMKILDKYHCKERLSFSDHNVAIISTIGRMNTLVCFVSECYVTILSDNDIIIHHQETGDMRVLKGPGPFVGIRFITAIDVSGKCSYE